MGTNQKMGALKAVLANRRLPPGITVRCWTEGDFAAIQALSRAADWPTPIDRPADAVSAWRESYPALVATDHSEVIGFLRALNDGAVTTYIAELLVALVYQRRGIGTMLLDACQDLCPTTRLDLLSTEAADQFYATPGFRWSAEERPAGFLSGKRWFHNLGAAAIRQLHARAGRCRDRADVG